MEQMGLGLLLGIPIALAGGASWGDSYAPMVLGGAVTVLEISAVVAGLLPALRAASIHPMEALRAE